MDAPTAATIRSWSKVNFNDRGFTIDTAPEPDVDQLTRVVENAVFWIERVTGRDLSSIDLTGTPSRATLRLARMMEEAIRMLVEHMTAAAAEEHSETAADYAMIQSFSAGSYSEQRRGGRLYYRFHPWRELDDLLGQIATDGVLSGLNGGVPGIDAPEPDWDVGKAIIDARRGRYLTPFGPPNPPWD